MISCRKSAITVQSTLNQTTPFTDTHVDQIFDKSLSKHCKLIANDHGLYLQAGTCFITAVACGTRCGCSPLPSTPQLVVPPPPASQNILVVMLNNCSSANITCRCCLLYFIVVTVLFFLNRPKSEFSELDESESK